MSGSQRRLGTIGIVLCLMISGILLSIGGCVGAHASVRKQAKKQELLRESVEAYWHALRWGYYDRAVPFVEEPTARALLWEYLLDREGKATINDATVYRLDWPGDDKPAEVYVRYQLYLNDELVVTNRKAVQTWYLSNGRWYLDLTPEELALLSPAQPESEPEGGTDSRPRPKKEGVSTGILAP